ncbi:hypothetical protein CLAFUW4_10894 [Fulvia fulva]|uniref:Uncharacterized protein n=1 Tax=Passalora fulva TaxID=5499 RepID=A0A9Q8US46_PASFU|nr:uncharacterized protein CLAFUR5_09936 [Fulvia fulva]KAK4619735.1 hypothetical protein CLAFUR4_10899 [Fulvia fulva]KAK4620857.1 hypothetical protein CLAFUR0_10906 [Fulvia fulva]UJO20408.1 hypothetical protein CLAFUR5_09936 [Fulvia fulva]WPV17031.1 hypothetical protein CLAFUW4_10894 [Fulvia fulva]WPV32233.1 hypothetical protein CLAFUW7_10892 [Fulvia fulva]
MADTDRQLSAIDILITRQNIALARSQKLLQSWLPAKASEQPTSAAADSDQDDFQGLGEATGIGAKRKNEDDSELGGILKRRRTDNDKLLENLIGKKAAQARKKSQEAEKSTHAARKPLESQKLKMFNKPAESEDEEEGRASAFTSKKQRRSQKNATMPVDAVAVAGADDEDTLNGDAEPPDPREDAAVLKELAGQADIAADDSEAEDPRPQKRKAGSYLDELLAQKAKKKNKKKKKGKSDV